MKHVLMMALAAGALLFTACGGTPGPAGPSGTNGTNGNANAKQYTFGTRTTTSGVITYNNMPLTQMELDSSSIVLFHESPDLPTVWFATPGSGASTSYITRASYRISDQNLRIDVVLLTPSATIYTVPTTFSRFRVIIIPTSSNVTLAKTSGLNLNDYNAVRKFYNLPE